MPIALPVALFFIGLAVGSFLNVVIARYDAHRPFFSFRHLLGRSRCPQCTTSLRWRELIPLASFVIQGRRCRTCRGTISFQYPVVEFVTGVLFAAFGATLSGFSLFVWLAASAVFIVIAAIDIRLMIIPDGANIAIFALGAMHAAPLAANQSFLGFYAMLFSFQDAVWPNRAIAAGAAAAFFGAVIFLTRGRGMGMGDMKLAGAAGILLGWPDVLLALILSFVAGSLWSVILIARGRKGLKSTVPFGPFIVLGIFLTAFFGFSIMDGYFRFFSWMYE